MKFSISQPTYEVRDASEIAFGILILSIVFLPVSLGGGFFIGLAIAAIWQPAEPPVLLVPTCSILCWLILMWFVIRRYKRIAAGWHEERRGRSTLHLVEWMAVGVNLLLAFASQPGLNEAFTIIRLFLAVLITLLLLSHVGTYLLLRYRPTVKEGIVWAVMLCSLLWEMYRVA